MRYVLVVVGALLTVYGGVTLVSDAEFQRRQAASLLPCGVILLAVGLATIDIVQAIANSRK